MIMTLQCVCTGYVFAQRRALWQWMSEQSCVTKPAADPPLAFSADVLPANIKDAGNNSRTRISCTCASVYVWDICLVVALTNTAGKWSNEEEDKSMVTQKARSCGSAGGTVRHFKRWFLFGLDWFYIWTASGFQFQMGKEAVLFVQHNNGALSEAKSYPFTASSNYFSSSTRGWRPKPKPQSYSTEVSTSCDL